MPKTPAALRASSWSSTHGHIVLSLKKLESDQFFINTPVASYPSSFNNAAATELSTPPLIATNTCFLVFVMAILLKKIRGSPTAHLDPLRRRDVAHYYFFIHHREIGKFFEYFLILWSPQITYKSKMT